MISISNKKWTERKVNKNSIEKIKQDFKFSDILSRLIISRNFDLTEIYNIKETIKITNKFVTNTDFNKASDLLIDSINNNEKICILGDYDVDGSSATSLLVRFLNYIKIPNFYHIPDREKDGYGASKKLFEKLIKKKPKLIIMVDCGSTSNDAVEFLNKKKIKSIIIDHHEINKPYPKSNSIINPKKDNGYKEYDYFCATALTYFFLDLVIKKIKSNYKLSSFLIYVVLATICDVMPLRKMNRVIVKNVIDKFDVKQNIAFNYLFKLNNNKNKLNINDLGYYIGPIINSGGRLGKSNFGTDLLSSENFKVIKKKSDELFKLNNKRKLIEDSIINDIDFKQIQKKNKSVIVYYKENINEGLIGIIAARLKEYFNKPSIVITNSNNILKGSCRSTFNYNIGHLIKKLLDNNIIDGGGGHNLAAGFTMQKNKVNDLEKFILIDYENKNATLNHYNIFDLEISPSAFNINLLNEVNRLQPFGSYNTLPLFYIKKLKVIKTVLLQNKHITAILKPQIGSSIKSICFNCIGNEVGKYLLSYKKNINVIGQIHENIWNNKKNLQLNIKDIVI